MIYAIYIALAVVAFLAVLNGYLRGAYKPYIDAVVGVLLLGLVVGAFIVSGWKLGLLAVAVPFLAGVVARPLAARTASGLLRHLEGARGRYVGLPPRSLERVSRQLGRPTHSDPGQLAQELPQEMLAGKHCDANALNALLDFVESQTAIQAVMNEFQISRGDLKELYYQLLRAGAGEWVCSHWVAASALAYPDALRYALSRRGIRSAEGEIMTAFKLVMHFERGVPFEP